MGSCLDSPRIMKNAIWQEDAQERWQIALRYVTRASWDVRFRSPEEPSGRVTTTS